ncbi:hypothetical protein [uncultured Eubacterium sp.]|uniref:hypothetical protein n=1 Tax=uncultured Eubacterium sp. TaxID=165185 RepID=UPI00267249C3|nr:hypothetical protein [uncultured Eubacterium sp.]
MRKGFFKKVTATVLALTMIVGATGVVSAAKHAANGANIASNIKWDYYSVLSMKDHKAGEDGSRQHPYCWYHALTHISTEDYPNGQVPGKDFVTDGYVAQGATSSAFTFYAVNTGWDGEYNSRDGSLVGDNPWGLRAFSSNIPVEKGRSYTLSFKYNSSLKGKTTVYEKDADGEFKLDENGDKIPVKDAAGEVVQEDNFIKHVGLSVINPANNNGLDFTAYSGCTSGGFFVADSSNKNEKTISVTFKVPKTYPGSEVAIQFAMGAYLVTYPDELAMKGSLNISDLKLTAGTQYSVKYSYGKSSYTQYVNAGEKASGYQFAVKGKTFTGYKNAATGAKYSLSTPVKGNLNLTCVYSATKKPGKAKVKFTAQKKKAKLSIKKIANAKGYEIKYANNSKMKKAKTKTTTKTSITIKKLKSGKKTYFRVRAYNLDSAGKKVYSKKTLKKTVVIK